MDRCYVCLKPLPEKGQSVYLEDNDHATVPVGADCFFRVAEAGFDGLRAGNGKGPRVFFERVMAEEYVRQPRAAVQSSIAPIFAVESPTGRRVLVQHGVVGYFDCEPEVWVSRRKKQTDAITDAALAGSLFGWHCPAAKLAYEGGV